jgi:predicted alpha/beta-fold hydrolase
MAINPPIDLAALIARLEHPSNKFYHHYFTRTVLRAVARRHQSVWPADVEFPRIKSPQEFNERFLAPVCGFGTAERYYALCSSARFLPAIRLPTLLLTSRDDPLIPARSFEQVLLSPSTRLVMTDRGGHLGYLGSANPRDPDSRWMDWRVVDWVTRQESVLARFSVGDRRGSPASAVQALSHPEDPGNSNGTL